MDNIHINVHYNERKCTIVNKIKHIYIFLLYNYMKNKDIYRIKSILEKWSDYKGKISFTIFKNMEIVDTLINIFDNMIIRSDDYENKKKLICEKYSSGMDDVKYIIENTEDFNKEMDDLDYNYIKSNQLLDSECVVQFYKINIEDLPENLSANEIKEISFMI